MPIKKIIQTSHVPVKIWTDEVDGASLDQLRSLASLPFIFRHVAAMPDVHLGKGATVGSVIATERVLIPAAVGVDIGCGMTAARLALTADQLPASLAETRAAIEARIPLGVGGNHLASRPCTRFEEALWPRLSRILECNPGFVSVPPGRAAGQLGTLGSGNHFIELCLDEEDRCWVLLHSGSRGIGNRIGWYFIGLTREEMTRWHISLPDRDLAYLPEGTDIFDRYIEAMQWAQDYAQLNRDRLLAETLIALHETLSGVEFPDEVIRAHHNYVAREHHFGRDVWVTRKGAIRARPGDLGIVPGSIGTGSYIVRGLGNRESFCSCSHGAGRRFSRSEAKRRFTTDDLADQTAGIECRTDAGVLDEIPAAYKSIESVMANQSDLVEVVHSLRQVLSVKG